jgi:hypothetical protein
MQPRGASVAQRCVRIRERKQVLVLDLQLRLVEELETDLVAEVRRTTLLLGARLLGHPFE